MRLWYQSLTRADAWPAYNAALRRMLAAAADPGTEFEVHGITRRGGVGDQYRSLEFIETIEVLENVAHADASGFDAILLGNIADPGLRAAREMARVPASVYGESSRCVSSNWRRCSAMASRIAAACSRAAFFAERLPRMPPTTDRPPLISSPNIERSSRSCRLRPRAVRLRRIPPRGL